MKTKYIVLILIIAIAACESKKDKVVDLEIDVAPQDTVQVVESTPQPEPVVEIVDEGVNQDDRYFLIIDSYTVKEFAESWNKKYRDQGFKSDLVMKNEDGYYRLALKSFDDLKLAEEALAKLQKDTEYENVWIMVK
ncbi:SPOR domain-containing protein [Sunxiuqinia sp. A32]|uniref:SPOR domain-containing protein n=1 Tax=Sunxiuqinia sp. A32 TaxID=3461496 RepID=UPI0040457E8F